MDLPVLETELMEQEFEQTEVVRQEEFGEVERGNEKAEEELKDKKVIENNLFVLNSWVLIKVTPCLCLSFSISSWTLYVALWSMRAQLQARRTGTQRTVFGPESQTWQRIFLPMTHSFFWRYAWELNF